MGARAGNTLTQVVASPRTRLRGAVAGCLAVAVLCAPIARARASGFLAPARAAAAPGRVSGLQAETHDVRVQGTVALVTARQLFKSDPTLSPSCDFVLPVPREGPWRDVRVQVAGSAAVGRWFRGEDAKRYLRDQLQRTRRRGLAQWWHHDLYVVPVQRPTDVPQFEIVSRHERSLEDPSGVAALDLRCVSADDGTAKGVTWQGEIHIDAGHARGPVWSPTTALRQALRSDDDMHLRFAHNARPCMDRCVLAWETSGAQTSTLLLTDWRPGAPAGRFAMLLAPSAGHEAAPPRALCLAIDLSASMRGGALGSLRAALPAVLADLGPQDRVHVLGFGESLQLMNPAPEPVTPALRTQAKQFLAERRPAGRADFGLVLDHLASLPRPAGLPLQCVLVTDGRPRVARDALLTRWRDAAARSAPRSLYPIGLGVDVDTVFLERLARAAGGWCHLGAPQGDAGASLRQLVGRLGRTWLHTPQVDLDALQPFDTAHRGGALPDLYRDGHRIVVGRYRRSGTHDVALRGREGPLLREYHAVVRAAPPGQARPFGPGIERLLAWRKAARLVDEIRLGSTPPAGATADLVRLGATSGALTEFTASLADSSSALPGDFAAHRRVSDELLELWRARTTGATGWAQAVANLERHRSLRAPAGPVPLLLGARGDRDVVRIPLLGVRHAGALTLFHRKGEGWVEGSVAHAANARILRPGTERFESWLDGMKSDELMCLGLEGDLLLAHGQTTVRITRMR